MVVYVAVGFKVSQENSIFYFKEVDYDKFMQTLKEKISATSPDVVSMRIVRP